MFSMFKSNMKEYEGKNFYSYSARNSNGEEIAMSTYLGKVCLVVNVASQYEEAEPSALNFPTTGLADENFKQLAELDRRYRNDGLVILGFPTNQFAGMEPSVQEEIVAGIHRKYNVDFEIFQKIDVNGPNTHPLFDYLKNILTGTITNDLKWHFTKFLIDRNGNPAKRYAPNDTPLSFEEEIRFLLKQESVFAKAMGQPGINVPGQAGLQGQIGQQNLQGQNFPNIGLQAQGLQGQGLQSQMGRQERKDWQGEGKDWQGEGKDWQGEGKDWQGEGLPQEWQLGGKEKEKDWSLGQAFKEQPQTQHVGEQMNMQEQEDLENLRQREIELEHSKGIPQQYKTQKEGKSLDQTINEQLQRERELEQDHKRAFAELKQKGINVPSSQWGGITLQENIDKQLQRERELEQDHKRAYDDLKSRGIAPHPSLISKVTYSASETRGTIAETASNIAATASSYAQAAKDKVVDTAQAVKEKVMDTAHVMKEKISGVTDMSTEQQSKGFSQKGNLTGEGGVVGAQMGVHLGAHSVQAGVQAGKDPLKTQEQKK